MTKNNLYFNMNYFWLEYDGYGNANTWFNLILLHLHLTITPYCFETAPALLKAESNISVQKLFKRGHFQNIEYGLQSPLHLSSNVYLFDWGVLWKECEGFKIIC